MNTIITKKVMLKPAPIARETKIVLNFSDPASLTWGIFRAELDEGSAMVAINWGDGTNIETAEVDHLTHTYPRTGVYEVRISDDIKSMRCSNITSGTAYHDTYPKMIQEVKITATKLKTLSMPCFGYASNLQVFNCIDSGINTLEARSFIQCKSLDGKLYFPLVDMIEDNVFNGCTRITELHFAKANEETIKALPAWESSDHNFGASNAVVKFDL